MFTRKARKRKSQRKSKKSLFTCSSSQYRIERNQNGSCLVPETNHNRGTQWWGCIGAILDSFEQWSKSHRIVDTHGNRGIGNSFFFWLLARIIILNLTLIVDESCLTDVYAEPKKVKKTEYCNRRADGPPTRRKSPKTRASAKLSNMEKARETIAHRDGPNRQKEQKRARQAAQSYNHLDAKIEKCKETKNTNITIFSEFSCQQIYSSRCRNAKLRNSFWKIIRLANNRSVQKHDNHTSAVVNYSSDYDRDVAKNIANLTF